jgi:hypothetical protein
VKVVVSVPNEVGLERARLIARDEARLRSVRYLVERWAGGFPMGQHIYGVSRFDADAYRERYERHNREVRDYFSDRPEALMVIDVTSSPSWDRLCSFLGVPVPAIPFPRSGQPAR